MKKNKLYFIPIIVFLSTLIIPFSCEGPIEDDKTEEENVFAEDTVRFQDLTTLFENRCYHCHSEQEYSFYALNLDSYENTMLGSQNGSIVTPFEPENSLLYTKCAGTHLEGERMPQDDTTYFNTHTDKLELIYDWIYFGCLE
tara:strand:+ start:332 stop:757 length:426 start_codon:yes stop_codon:yes gene_type:complete